MQYYFHIASPFYMSQPLSHPGSRILPPHSVYESYPPTLTVYRSTCPYIITAPSSSTTCKPQCHLLHITPSPATNWHPHCPVAAAVNPHPCAPRLRFVSPNPVISTEAMNTYGLVHSAKFPLQNSPPSIKELDTTLSQMIRRFSNHFTHLVPQFRM